MPNEQAREGKRLNGCDFIFRGELYFGSLFMRGIGERFIGGEVLVRGNR